MRTPASPLMCSLSKDPLICHHHNPPLHYMHTQRYINPSSLRASFFRKRKGEWLCVCACLSSLALTHNFVSMFHPHLAMPLCKISHSFCHSHLPCTHKSMHACMHARTHMHARIRMHTHARTNAGSQPLDSPFCLHNLIPYTVHIQTWHPFCICNSAPNTVCLVLCTKHRKIKLPLSAVLQDTIK